MRKSLLIVFAFLCISCHAQKLFTTYSVQDGMVANSVRKIYQDSKGFIWICTWEGLSKYDGHAFTNFTESNGLSSNLVNDIHETPDGRLWIAENNGIVDIIEHDTVSRQAVYKNITINCFVITHDKKVFAGTDSSGFFELASGKLTRVQNAFSQYGFAYITPWKDSMLVGGYEKFIRILNYKNGKLLKAPEQSGLVNSMYEDSKHRLWACMNPGLKELNTQTDLTTPPALFNIPFIKNNGITAMHEDANGNYWFGSFSNGIAVVDPAGNSRIYAEKDGIPSGNVTCFLRDRENNIWIGTSQGLVKFVSRTFTTISLSDKAAEKLLLSKKPFFYSIRQGGTYNGLYDSANRKINIPLPPETYAIAIDNDHHFFAGAQKGLFVISNNKVDTNRLLSYRISNLLIDRYGYLWVGTWQNGLYRIRFSAAGILMKDYSYLVHGNAIRALYEDRTGNIWVGTRYDGVARLSKKQNDDYSVRQWGYKEGLTTNWVNCIAEDDAENVWLGSYIGIDKLVKQDTGFRVFNFSRINNFFASIASISFDRDKSLWVSTNSGLAHITDQQNENLPPLPVYITAVQLGKKRTYDTAKNNMLGYNENQAAFEFAAPGYINEKQIVYSYRLLGSEDTSWSKAGTTHSVSYASLKAGSYRFEVKTLGWNGQWGRPSSYEFSVRPPFWQTGWFVVGICILLLALAFLLFRFRLRQLVRIQQVRNRIAIDLHDDIGSSLTNISMLSELSNKNLQRPDLAQLFIHRISEEVNSSSQALDDIIWSVNSNHDTVEETLARMRRYASELFDAGDINCKLNLEDKAFGRKLSMEQRRDIYLIYKESLNNVYKHAQAANVYAEVIFQHQQIKMMIKDDGAGFNTDATSHRNGLKNLAVRVQKWKGEMQLASAKGSGTTIEITMPVG